MINSLDSSALFFTDSDIATINSFVPVVSSTPFRPIVAGKRVFKQQHKKIINPCINTSQRLDGKEKQSDMFEKTAFNYFQSGFLEPLFRPFGKSRLFSFSVIFLV